MNQHDIEISMTLLWDIYEISQKHPYLSQGLVFQMQIIRLVTAAGNVTVTVTVVPCVRRAAAVAALLRLCAEAAASRGVRDSGSSVPDRGPE